MKTPAFYDTFSGLIPCKVVAINDKWAETQWAGQSSSCELTVKLTASRGAYKRGETIVSDALKIIPRKHVRGNRIIGGYRWTQDKI